MKNTSRLVRRSLGPRPRMLIWPAAIAAARLTSTLLDGGIGEALSLRWDQFSTRPAPAVFLERHKDGKSVRPISWAACDLLQNMAASAPLRQRTSVPGDPRRRALCTGLSQVSGPHRQDWVSLPADVTPHALRHSVCEPRSRSRLFGTDNRSAGRTQGTISDIKIRAHRRRDTSRGCRRHRQQNGGIDG